MIKYSLICDKGHDFEGWFQNSEAFDKLAKAKQLSCEICGSKKVSKAMMSPRISVSKGSDLISGKVASHTTDADTSVTTKEMAELQQAFKKVRQYVEQNAEYVGPRFADEARKIYYKESEERGIYGEATVKEVRELAEEGVPVQPLPALPEDLN